MKFVERGPEPEVLKGQNRKREASARKATEFDKVIVHRAKQLELRAAGKKTKSFKFQLYGNKKVREELTSLFHGKCAYCETYYEASHPVDVEHYRPKNAVGGADHEGYWWLAMAWDNLLPSCIDCNRKRHQKAPKEGVTNLTELFDTDRDRTVSIKSGKGTTFPLVDESARVQYAEDASPADNHLAVENEPRLLLDPTLDDPEEHLIFSTKDISVVGPKTQMGAVSIQVYGLNRLGLVQERTKLLRDLDFLLDTYLELGSAIEQIDEKLSVPKQAEIDAASETQAAILEAELVEIKSITAKLSSLQLQIVDEVKRKAENPEQSYSMLVNAWLNAEMGA